MTSDFASSLINLSQALTKTEAFRKWTLRSYAQAKKT